MGKTDIRAARYSLKIKQARCPIPGCWRVPTDAHHTLIRRHPDHPRLWCRENITLVCHYHHVPECEDLGYWCVRYKLEVEAMEPRDIEVWVESLGELFKVPPTLPPFYHRAVADVFPSEMEDE